MKCVKTVARPIKEGYVVIRRTRETITIRRTPSENVHTHAELIEYERNVKLTIKQWRQNNG